MLLKKALIILLIIFRGNIIAQTTSIKQFGVDLIAEPFPNIVLLRTIEVEKKPILFYLIVSKNLCFRYKENIVEIKLFSRKIGYRASYNYIFAENEIVNTGGVIWVRDFNLQNLTLTRDHVYDLLSISYGKEYKVKGSINWYTHVNIGFSINFPGEFYYEYLWIHPINLKKGGGIIYKGVFPGSFIRSFREYDQYFKLKQIGGGIKSYYKAVFDSTSSYQWAINIILGLIENIFIEYVIEMPVCSFLAIYPLHIHISIGTILGTIECLYRYFKEEDGRGFLGYFYALFFLQSICVFKIGYYN